MQKKKLTFFQAPLPLKFTGRKGPPKFCLNLFLPKVHKIEDIKASEKEY